MRGQSFVVPRFPNFAFLVLGPVLLIAASLSACAPVPDVPDSGQRELRLVDPGSRALMQLDLGGDLGADTAVITGDGMTTTDYPVATINDDSRYALAAPAFDWLLVQTGTEIPAGGLLALSPGYPLGMPWADQVLILPRAKVDGAWLM